MKIRAINEYNIERDQKKGTTTIEYYIDGEFFAQSVYDRIISDEKKEKIERDLMEYTTINKNAETLCEAIYLPTILNEVERIIFDD